MVHDGRRHGSCTFLAPLQEPSVQTLGQMEAAETWTLNNWGSAGIPCWPDHDFGPRSPDYFIFSRTLLSFVVKRQSEPRYKSMPAVLFTLSSFHSFHQIKFWNLGYTCVPSMEIEVCVDTDKKSYPSGKCMRGTYYLGLKRIPAPR